MINFLLSVINEKKFLYMFYNLKRSSVKSLNFYNGRKKFLDESVYLAWSFIFGTSEIEKEHDKSTDLSRNL